jgi:hypothetical protein
LLHLIFIYSFIYFSCIGYLLFTDCSAPHGNIIYINGSGLPNIVTKNSFGYSYSLVDENDLRGYERDGDKLDVDLRDYLCKLSTPTGNTWDIFECDDGCYQYVVCIVDNLYLFLY